MSLVDGAIRVAQTAVGTLLFILAVGTGMSAAFLADPWRWVALAAFVGCAAAYAILAWRARAAPS